MKGTVQERFWAKVKKTEGCWIWTASKYPVGYGIFSVARKPVGAHRWAYEDANGPIPPGLCVCHHCDNRACVRPDHLFLGTKQDNTDDMMRKGRFWFVPAKPLRGEENPCSKFTTRDVLRIRELCETMTQKQVATIYGVRQGAISRIVRRERWRHI